MTPFALLGRIDDAPMEKKAWGLIGRAGAALTRGAAAGGTRAAIGKGLTSSSGFMGRHGTKLMLGGMAGQAMGVPGAGAVADAAMPGWALAQTAPNFIRSGRLASGDYNDDIEADARSGAQFAGVDYLDVASQNPYAALNAPEYSSFMENNGAYYDPAAVQQYQTGNFGPQHGWFGQLGAAAHDPTALAMPQLQQQIYKQLR